ncbi:DUF6801 domain-containing protein [Streptomyces sp. NPDC056452]|uniref:DUF6801 domain-containing protein n=1 Tax=Streptomyces sp. NPDC056452 TaxID=3345821 RepID=UPI0036C82694
MRGVSGRSRGRATARGGAVLAAVLMAGMIPGAQASDGSRDVDAELTYSCDFPAGPQQVKVRVSATVPDEGRPDEAVQLTGVGAELTLPGESLAGLTGAGTASVEAETRLTVDVTQDGHSAEAVWAGATENPVSVPDEGDITLAVSGDVPSVTASASGELVFTAGELTALLTARKADGTPVEPPAPELVCSPEADQDLVLGKVAIGGDGEEPVPWPSASSETPDPGGTERDEAAPRVGTEDGAPAAADAPECVGDREDPFNLVAYITGYANVTKLKGASKFPLACAQIHQGPQGLVLPGNSPDGKLHLVQDSTAVVEYLGRPQLPPATSTFLTFGFMPTTAIMEMTQRPPGLDADGKQITNVHSDLTLDGANSFGHTIISMQFSLRLHDVKVNGVPMDVGPNCRTAKDFSLSLRGEVVSGPGGFTGYTLAGGGPLKGSVVLPPFSGCGVGEDLDSLFTASISGEPGYVKQMQGAPCAPFTYDQALCTEDRQPRKIPTAER